MFLANFAIGLTLVVIVVKVFVMIGEQSQAHKDRMKNQGK